MNVPIFQILTKGVTQIYAAVDTFDLHNCEQLVTWLEYKHWHYLEDFVGQSEKIWGKVHKLNTIFNYLVPGESATLATNPF